MLEKRRVLLVVVRRGDSLFVEGFQNVIVFDIQVLIRLIKLLLVFLVNLVALVVLLGLLDEVLEFEDIYFEGLPFDFGEPVLYRCELFLVLRLRDQSEVTLEVPLIALLLRKGLIPGYQDIVVH